MVEMKKAGTVARRAETSFFVRPVTGIIGGVSGLVGNLLSDVSDFIGFIPDDLRTDRAGSTKCPFCAETTKRQVIEYRYYRSDLEAYEEGGSF